MTQSCTTLLALLILGVSVSCARTPVSAEGNQESDWAAIEKLESNAKELVKVSGCTTASDCRTAPVGSRACGGPRYYLTYCARTTDSAALFSRLGEIAKAEDAFNRKYGIASTCEFRTPPGVAVSGEPASRSSCVWPRFAP